MSNNNNNNNNNKTLWDLCCSLLFCRNWQLVLTECIDLLFHAWYLDDGVLAGNRLAVSRAFFLIQELGPALGFQINLGKCELFARRGNTLFPSAIPCSTLPNLIISGAPMGDYIHCSRVVVELCTQAKPLLQCLQEMAGIDLQVAVTLLRVAGSYCQMVHLARATPPNLASDALEQFDKAVRECFQLVLQLMFLMRHGNQAQLGLRHGGLGLRSLSLHAPAAFIASLISSWPWVFGQHLSSAGSHIVQCQSLSTRCTHC